MLGLIEKDLRLALTRRQILAFFFIAAMLMGISVDASFLISYLTMFATIVAVGTISYDESDNGFAFLMTLPFDRKTYVREKYLFSLLLAATAWCLGVALYCIGSLIRHGAINPASKLPMLLSLLPVLYLATAIMIPLLLNFGSEKSRIVFYSIFGAIAVLLIASKRFSGGSDNILARLAKILDGMPPTLVLVILTAICVLAACISYIWSIQIMSKKEF